MGFFSRLLWGRGHQLKDLARRLDLDARELRSFQPNYRQFTLPKRSGGERTIFAPDDATKRLQRKILKRLLNRLRVHPSATGFQRGRSIVTNARAHCGRAAVLRFDLVDFFPSTSARRVYNYFRHIGWNRQAANCLVRILTYRGGLPQGAPTSPRLSNLLNYRLDARLAGMAKLLSGVYTRYADDITISLVDPEAENKDHGSNAATLSNCLPTLSTRIAYLQRFVRKVTLEEGYQLHRRKKTSVRRQHHRQQVTGLVVNQRVSLPRETRRWLRAVEHRMRVHKDRSLTSSQSRNYLPRPTPTLTESQLAGWQAFRSMIDRQSQDDDPAKRP